MNKTSTILVVEDDSAVRNLISTTLQAHNYKYLLASNGETAILEASSHNPALCWTRYPITPMLSF